MKMEKILNSWLGIVIAALVALVAGRVVRMVSWNLYRVGGYILLGAAVMLALTKAGKH